jgi:hypothetical protein
MSECHREQQRSNRRTEDGRAELWYRVAISNCYGNEMKIPKQSLERVLQRLRMQV